MVILSRLVGLGGDWAMEPDTFRAALFPAELPPEYEAFLGRPIESTLVFLSMWGQMKPIGRPVHTLMSV
jgi:hypothetical protein